MIKYAHISQCEEHRYDLVRDWGESVSFHSDTTVFVMLNPSKADAYDDDPTVRRCMGFARQWLDQNIVIVNLFSLRATDPRELMNAVRSKDPITDPQNDISIARAVRAAQRIVFAWGGSLPKPLERRVDEVINLVNNHKRPSVEIQCLGYTKHGNPRHPLMLAYKTDLEKYVHNA